MKVYLGTICYLLQTVEIVLSGSTTGTWTTNRLKTKMPLTIMLQHHQPPIDLNLYIQETKLSIKTWYLNSSKQIIQKSIISNQ